MQKLNFSPDGFLPAYSHLTDSEPNLDDIKESVAMLLDGEGWKIVRRNPIFHSVTPCPPPNYKPATCKTTFVGSKIPLRLFVQIEEFFKAVYVKQKSEALVLLYYHDATRQYKAVVVEQQALGLHVDGLGKDIPAPDAGWIFAGDIHSHANVSAFHSGTDDKDEQFKDGIHITIGNVDGDNLSYSFSITNAGQRTMLRRSDMVETVDFPPEWLDMVKEPPTVISTPLSGFMDGQSYQKWWQDRHLPEHYRDRGKKKGESSGHATHSPIPENVPLKQHPGTIDYEALWNTHEFLLD